MDANGNRKYKRFLVDDCAVEVTSGVFAKGEHCPVLSLSAEGMQYVSFDRVKEGQRLNLGLRVAADFDFLKTAGAVRWCHQVPDEDAYQVGVEMTKLSNEEKQKLRHLRRAYWPRQQQIVDMAAQNLKVPEPVAKKLAALLEKGYKRSRVDTSAEEGGEAGPWIDTERAGSKPETGTDETARPDLGAGAGDRPAAVDTKEEDDRPGELPSEPDHTRPYEDGMRKVPVIKLYWLGGKYNTRLGKRGRPIGSMAKMWLPGIDKKHFACRLADSSMVSKLGRSFNHGDVVVFSMRESAKDGAYAFVGTKDKACCFRRVHHNGNGTVVLTAANSAHDEVTVDAEDVEVMWPAVACLQSV